MSNIRVRYLVTVDVDAEVWAQNYPSDAESDEGLEGNVEGLLHEVIHYHIKDWLLRSGNDGDVTVLNQCV